MNKKLKTNNKILSVILALLMIISAIPVTELTAFAATSGDFEYTVLGDGTAEITNYTGFETNLTIPSTLGEYTVTSIGESAFEGCEQLTEVTIPNGVKNIGDYAFSLCQLKNINIPESVITLGEGVFYICYDLEEITVDSQNKYYSSQDGVLFDKGKTELIQYPTNNSRTQYTIPDTVTEIALGAFTFSRSLVNVTIPNGVTDIGDAAFAYCVFLASITIPKSVTYIGALAFGECYSLGSITIYSTDCLIVDNDYVGDEDYDYSAFPTDKIIYGYTNSTAQKYAEKHGNTFVALDEMSEIKNFNVSNIKTTGFDVSFDKVNGATNYWVQLSKDGGKTWSVVTTLNTNKGTVSGLESNKDYQVRIRAYKLVNGEKVFITPWSNIQNVRTLDAGSISKSLAAPKNLVLSNTTTNGVTISFDKVSNADGYEIQYYHNGEWIHYVNTGYTSKAWIGWGAAGTFDIRVRAYVKSGSEVIYSSNWSEAKRFYTKPNQVTGVKTASRSADGTSLTITWDQQKWATGYCVYKRGTNNKWWLIATIYGPAENSYTITGLTPTYDYGYKVRAFKGGSGNLGAFSDEHSTYTSPSQPKLYSVISDAKGKLYVSWVYGKCQGYELMVSTTPNFSKNNTSYYYSGETNNKVTIKSLKSGTYYVRVRAYYQKPSGRVYSVWTGAREIGVK